MSQFSGPQDKGAMRDRRKVKREDAEARNALTEPTDRRSYRLAAAKAEANGTAA